MTKGLVANLKDELDRRVRIAASARGRANARAGAQTMRESLASNGRPTAEPQHLVSWRMERVGYRAFFRQTTNNCSSPCEAGERDRDPGLVRGRELPPPLPAFGGTPLG